MSDSEVSEVMLAMWLSNSKCNKCNFFDRKKMQCVEPTYKKSKKSTCNSENSYIKFKPIKNAKII